MKNIFVLCIISLSFVSCGTDSDSSGSKPQTYVEFASPHDPCLFEGACTNSTEITLKQAYDYYLESLVSPVKGDQVSHYVEVTDTHYKWDPNSDDVEKSNCDVAYDMTRTLADFDDEHIYVEEKKRSIRVKPESEACLELLTYTTYKESIITKEDRMDVNPDTLSDDLRIGFKGLKFSLVSFNGARNIRTNGVLTFSYTTGDSNGNHSSGSGKSSILSMHNIDRSTFQAMTFDHSISKTDDYSDEELNKYVSYAQNIDVSHIDVWSMDEWDIVDRSSSEDEDNTGFSKFLGL